MEAGPSSAVTTTARGTMPRREYIVKRIMKSVWSYKNGRVRVQLANGKQSPWFDDHAEARKWVDEGGK